MSRGHRQKFQTFMLLIAVSAIITYYLLDVVQLATATLVVVRDLKAQSQETAAAVSKMMHETEGEAND